MEKEAKELLDFVEYVVASEYLRSYFRRHKNKLYRWDLKYKDDDMKTLVEDIYRHQDYIG
jgi:hypothetical protein